MITIELTERELALIFLMRRIRFGELEGVTIHQGEPSLVRSAAQRLDLQKPGDLATLLSRSSAVGADLSQPGRPSCIEDLNP